MRLGIFSDPHISDKPNDEVRYYERSFSKVQKLFDFFHDQQLDGIVCLGDLFDSRNDSWVEQAIFKFQKEIKNLELPFVLALGNHDTHSSHYPLIQAIFNPNSKEDGFISIRSNGYTFIVLNTNFCSDGTAYNKDSVDDQDLYISDKQIELLEAELSEGTLPTVIFTHAKIVSAPNSNEEIYTINNADRVVNLLESHPEVKLVLQGHSHQAEVLSWEGRVYVTLAALVDGATQLPCIIADFSSEKIELFFYDTNEQAEMIKGNVINIPVSRIDDKKVIRNEHG